MGPTTRVSQTGASGPGAEIHSRATEARRALTSCPPNDGTVPEQFEAVVDTVLPSLAGDILTGSSPAKNPSLFDKNPRTIFFKRLVV